VSADAKVSALLSVHRDRGGLQRTVESVLAQDFDGLELVVVDDGARDHTPTLLADLAARDSRLRVLTLPENQGLTAALNRGLAESHARWIARIDEGDRWLPGKLRQQWARIEAEPRSILVGTQVQLEDPDSGLRYPSPRLPTEDADLRRWLLAARNPFVHSAVLFRPPPGVTYNEGRVLPGRALDTISDYELWLRLSAAGRLANIPAVGVYLSYGAAHAGLTTDRAALQFDLKVHLRDVFHTAVRNGDAATVAAYLREGLPLDGAPRDLPVGRRRLSFRLRYAASHAGPLRRLGLRAAGYALDPAGLRSHLRTKLLQRWERLPDWSTWGQPAT
jgi:glycosyltransferase involved in cell wall biosynthesis